MKSITRMAAATAVMALGQLAVSAARDLYVASEFTSSIKRYDGVTGAYLGDFVSAFSGGLNHPQGCLFGPDGNLYVTGAGNGSVLRYNGTTGAFMGAFTSGASFGFGADMSFHDGSLYVSDFVATGHVNRFDANTGVFQGNFTSDSPSTPDGLTWDAAGNLYVSSFAPGTVRKYDSAGAFQNVFATLPAGGKALDNRFGDDGNFYVSDYTHGAIAKFNGATGAYLGNFITGLGQTQGMEIGPDGGLYVGSYSGSFINEYSASTGAFIRTFASGGGLGQPNDFTFGPASVPEPGLCLALTAVVLVWRRGRRKLVTTSLS